MTFDPRRAPRASSLVALYAERKRHKLEDQLWQHLDAMHRVHGLPLPEREYRFDPARRWRLDFAWVEQRLAVEVEGLTGGAGGRHQRAAGFERDAEKYNALTLAGWHLLRFPPAQIRSGRAITAVRVFLERAQALRRTP